MNARNMSMSASIVVALAVSGFSAASAGKLDQLSVQFLQGNEGQNNEGHNTVTTKPSRDIRIEVWTDVEEESLMQRGEEFTLSFQTNSDLYVVIYKIDVEGRAEVVWPSSRYSDGFVYGNHAYSIPRPGQPGRLRVGSVKGVEYVEAIASSYPFDLPRSGSTSVSIPMTGRSITTTSTVIPSSRSTISTMPSPASRKTSTTW